MNRESVLLTAAALLAAASRLFAQDSIWIADGLQGRYRPSIRWRSGNLRERSSLERGKACSRSTETGPLDRDSVDKDYAGPHRRRSHELRNGLCGKLLGGYSRAPTAEITLR